MLYYGIYANLTPPPLQNRVKIFRQRYSYTWLTFDENFDICDSVSLTESLLLLRTFSSTRKLDVVFIANLPGPTWNSVSCSGMRSSVSCITNSTACRSLSFSQAESSASYSAYKTSLVTWEGYVNLSYPPKCIYVLGYYFRYLHLSYLKEAALN